MRTRFCSSSGIAKKLNSISPDKNVIDGQRLFDQVAGDVLKRFLVGDLAPYRAVQVPPKGAGKEKRNTDPDTRPSCRFLEADTVLLAAADDKQVDC